MGKYITVTWHVAKLEVGHDISHSKMNEARTAQVRVEFVDQRKQMAR